MAPMRMRHRSRCASPPAARRGVDAAPSDPRGRRASSARSRIPAGMNRMTAISTAPIIALPATA
jgi:hypothetical protein